MKRVLTLFFLLTTAMAAQEIVRKFIPLKHTNSNTMAELLGVFGQQVRSNQGLPGLIVSGPPDIVKAMEEMVARIDIPPAVRKNIELTAYLLVGTEAGVSGTLPAAIQPAIKQLQSLFSYKAFQILDTLFLRLREGESGSSSNGAVYVAGDSLPGTSNISLGRVDLLPGAEGNLIRINNLRLGVTVPNGRLGNGDPRLVNTSMKTDIDIREGQKVVVGKAQMTGPPDQALILILTAKVVD